MPLRSTSVALAFAAILFGCGSADSASSSLPVTPIVREPVNAASLRCQESAGAPHAFETKEDFVAATNGRWLFCSGHRSFDADAVGFESVGGEEYFLLRTDFSGNVVRGAQPGDHGRVTVSTGAAEYSLFLDTYGGPTTLTILPKRMTLSSQAGAAEYAASP